MKFLFLKNRGVIVKGDNYECTCIVCERVKETVSLFKGILWFYKGKNI